MSYSKYRAKKVTIDNIKFDSLKEGNRYKELKLMERANIISNLRCHVPYVLIKKSKYGSDVKYIADFVYIEGGKEGRFFPVTKTMEYQNKGNKVNESKDNIK